MTNIFQPEVDFLSFLLDNNLTASEKIYFLKLYYHAWSKRRGKNMTTGCVIGQAGLKKVFPLLGLTRISNLISRFSKAGYLLVTTGGFGLPSVYLLCEIKELIK